MNKGMKSLSYEMGLEKAWLRTRHRGRMGWAV